MRCWFRNRNIRQNRCPSCRKHVEGDAALVYGDLICPHCGTLLWFFGVLDEHLFFEYNEAARLREKVEGFLPARFELNEETITSVVKFATELEADSLDLVEIIMELEEEFGDLLDGERE